MKNPIDISRRAVVTATAPIALDLAMPAFVRPVKADATHPDAKLLALAQRYDNTLAALHAVNKEHHSPAENAYLALLRSNPDAGKKLARRSSGLIKAERLQRLADRENRAVIRQIAAIRATTIDGMRLKARISNDEYQLNPDILDSIVDDLIGMEPKDSAF